jgi:hypothetical protein
MFTFVILFVYSNDLDAGVNVVRTIGVNFDREFHLDLARNPVHRVLQTQRGGLTRVSHGMKGIVDGVNTNGRYRIKLGDNIIMDVHERDLKKISIPLNVPAYSEGEIVHINWQNELFRATITDTGDVQVVFTGEAGIIKKIGSNAKYHISLKSTGLTIIDVEEQYIEESLPEPPMPPKPTNLRSKNERDYAPAENPDVGEGEVRSRSKSRTIFATCTCEERCPNYPTCGKNSDGLQIISNRRKSKSVYF